MQYRYLGRSGLRVSVLGLGTMTFGGVNRFALTGNTDVAGATRLLSQCHDAGINLIDTADVYSSGVSEEIVGAAMAGRRSQFVLATKARFRMGDGPNDAGLSRLHLIRACEASLKRLQTDYIDLYQLHQWDGQTPLEETMEALDTLQRSGKVRYIGCSNFSAWHIMKAMGIAERAGSARFVSQQIYYSLEAREADHELLPASVDQGLGVLVWSPLAGGLLSGKYRRGVPPAEGTRHFTDWGEPPVHDENRLYNIIEALVAIGESRGVSAAVAALAWTLERPAMASLIIGVRTEAQLAQNLAAAEFVLTAEERAILDAVSAPPLPYPLWHQVNHASDRLGPADLATLAAYIRP